mmetsp:Transcript_16446/g.47630  ORF Transcript_16446/g.47630 Transcript_16446/m.47630 type:complete len:189 (+) Transcript_16446:89-655(+)|eukprot:CAMPEP_0176076376 /NCGR_PEP_ID=MMETSP0120_2-20121206/38181_1 /TAXON_ID=160619 /ORGANISM="Kryptoperidinium foliaceum, Strain CCMP 1326" /LENGTH=188 /DNA_ID=CAMNT_0017410095 /DNA_START=53 /DNA_END=619 /DNA_ORIENTATION=+
MAGSGCACSDRIKFARDVFTSLGAVVGLLFVVQGILVFVGTAVGHEKPPTDFWDGCHWLAHGVLCIAVGFLCFAFEVKSCFSSVKLHLAWFAANRLGLALVYVWIGCYAAGGPLQSGPEWSSVLGHITGISAWVVGSAHILLMGCADRPPTEAPAVPETKPKAVAQDDELAHVQWATGSPTHGVDAVA